MATELLGIILLCAVVAEASGSKQKKLFLCYDSCLSMQNISAKKCFHWQNFRELCYSLQVCSNSWSSFAFLVLCSSLGGTGQVRDHPPWRGCLFLQLSGESNRISEIVPVCILDRKTLMDLFICFEDHALISVISLKFRSSRSVLSCA